jgi:lipopolysaccharide/colanic/teichoic acid biosynthesis glycosyltransferase
VDELPQLLNLLRGDMTLVGPRPEDPRYVRLYTPEQRGILNFKPGITSPASITYRHEEHLLQRPPADLDRFYMERLLPAKIEIDKRYMERRTARSDLGVVVRTAMSLARRDVPVEIEA